MVAAEHQLSSQSSFSWTLLRPPWAFETCLKAIAFMSFSEAAHREEAEV
jgi:hypothetical protein